MQPTQHSIDRAGRFIDGTDRWPLAVCFVCVSRCPPIAHRSSSKASTPPKSQAASSCARVFSSRPLTLRAAAHVLTLQHRVAAPCLRPSGGLDGRARRVFLVRDSSKCAKPSCSHKPQEDGGTCLLLDPPRSRSPFPSTHHTGRQAGPAGAPAAASKQGGAMSDRGRG